MGATPQDAPFFGVLWFWEVSHLRNHLSKSDVFFSRAIYKNTKNKPSLGLFRALQTLRWGFEIPGEDPRAESGSLVKPSEAMPSFALVVGEFFMQDFGI